MPVFAAVFTALTIACVYEGDYEAAFVGGCFAAGCWFSSWLTWKGR